MNKDTDAVYQTGNLLKSKTLSMYLARLGVRGVYVCVDVCVDTAGFFEKENERENERERERGEKRE